MDIKRPYCRALYDFCGECPGELSFLAGELIYLVSRVNFEWLNGKSQTTGNEGMLPANFVEIIVPLPNDGKETAQHENLRNSQLNTAATVQELFHIGMASVLYDFEARYPDELNVKAGDSIQILAFPDTEWAKCRDPITNQIGIVPQGFLHIFLDSLDASEMNNPVYEAVPSKSWFAEFETAPNLPPKSVSTSSLDWMSPWADASGSKKAFNPNVAPPPRPPPPKLETSKPTPLNARGQNTNLTPSANLFSTAPSSKKSACNTKDVQKNEWAEMVEEGEEADESLIGIAASTPIANPHNMVLNTMAASQSDAKTKVLMDLLNTETTYLFDLETWEMCIQQCAQLSAEDKKALTNGYLVLKQLSKSLIDALSAQKDLPVGDQTLGEVFLGLKDQFFSAFAQHFQYVEQITAIVENDEEDHGLQRALQSCVGQMRSHGSNVFDVPTAVSRPIQRCLKYPLYVSELLKNTPINHPDHPKLMESLRQLEHLASRMNECKRRKELVRKYKDQEQLSLAERIARINMHSLVKKSNRLKFRINRSIGFGAGKDNDTEFEYLVQLLEEAERRLCKFLYCAQLYRKHMDMAMKRYADCYKGVCQVQDEKIVKGFAQMFRRVGELYNVHSHRFEREVISEGRKLVRSELTKLIHKRFDKLADFEVAKISVKNAEEVEMRRNEFDALNNQIKAQLPRLISTINKRILQLIRHVNACHQQFLAQMDDWYSRERPEKVLQCAPSAPPFRACLSISLKHTLVEMDKIAAYLYQRQQQSSSANGGESLAMVRKKSLRLSLKAKSGQKKTFQQQKRPQTETQRDALMKICRAQNQMDKLRRVRRNWESAQLVLREGDLLWVKEHRQDGFCLCDNAVSIGLVPIELLSQVDTTLSFVNPVKQYAHAPISTAAKAGNHQGASGNQQTVKRQKSADWLDQLNSAVQPPAPSANSTVSRHSLLNFPSEFSAKNSSKNKDLIDFEENLIDLFSPNANNEADQTGKEVKPTRPMDDPFEELFQAAMQISPSSSDSGTHKETSPLAPEIPTRPKDGETNFDMFESSWAPSKQQGTASTIPTPFLPDETDGSTGRQPIRIAPPPPNQKKRGTTVNHPYSTLPSVAITPNNQFPRQNNAVPPPTYYSVPPISTNAFGSKQPQPPSQQFGTFAICIFDFEPYTTGASCDGQLKMSQGDMVEILRHNDDAGNSEWWLVKRVQDDTRGFVPANYLSLNNTRV